MVKLLPQGVQIGGGIRTKEDVERWLQIGAGRVIVGTVAATNPSAVVEWAGLFPDKIVIGIDVLDGRARTNGWQEDGGNALNLAKTYKESPIAAVLCTNIARDGMMGGPDTDLAIQVAQAADAKALVFWWCIPR